MHVVVSWLLVCQCISVIREFMSAHQLISHQMSIDKSMFAARGFMFVSDEHRSDLSAIREFITALLVYRYRIHRLISHQMSIDKSMFAA